MIGNKIAYVAIVSKNLDVTRAFLGEHLGLPHQAVDYPARDKQVDVFSIGDSALAIFEIGDPLLGGPTRAGVHHVALAVDDVQQASARAEAAGVRVEAPGRGLRGSPHAYLAPAGGIRLAFTEALPLARHAPGPFVERLDHLGVASADNNIVTEILVQRLGMPLDSYDTNTETIVTMETFASSKHGMGTHVRKSEVVGCNLCTFVTVGDTELECICGIDPVEAGNAMQPKRLSDAANSSAHARQNRGPGFHQGVLGKFIDQYGPGLHHIAIKTPDIDRTITELTKRGVVINDKTGRPAARRSKIAFVDLNSTGGLLMHFVERMD